MLEAEIQNKLGIEPGPTLTALVTLAERISPAHPSEAFDLLWLGMSWLEQGQGGGQGTPRNVHPFAETGGNLNHFGFLMDGDGPTEERPIVYVMPKDDDAATQIVAPNLRSFLGLIAIAFGEVVSRNATDADWFGFREEWYGDQPERLVEMQRLSDLLCTIPGVARPPNPAAVANACPNQQFTLGFDEVAGSSAVGDGGSQTFAPHVESLPRVSAKGVAIGSAAAALLHLWKNVPLTWSLIALPIGLAAAAIPHLRGYDTLTVSGDDLVCRRGKKQWQIKLSDVARLYKFGEQWVFETPAPHRRYYFRLRGHDHHLVRIAEVLDQRARVFKLGWVDGASKVLQYLK